MSKITDAFKNKPAYVGYLTAGDGGIDKSLQYFLALVKSGVDILEIGVPFSDPVADGPVIQAAAGRALKTGTTLENILDLVQALREKTTVPIILFSYYNPIFVAQEKYDFFKKAKQVGVDGCLLVDIPLEESSVYYQNCLDHQIDPIFVIATSTSPKRIKKIAAYSRGMMYYACRKGTTGIKNNLPSDFDQQIQTIKSLSSLPTVAGFGVSNRQMAQSIIQYADGFVVGSLFVKAIAEGIHPDALVKLARDIDPR